jgi:hypothetical protein
MTKEEQKKASKRESNRRYQDNLKTKTLTLSEPETFLSKSENDLSWSKIEEFFVTPKAIVLSLITLVFTSFLLWQGTVFFIDSGLKLVESLIFSFIGEALFLCSAAFLFIGETRRQKLFSFFIFSSSFLALVVFLHHGASTHSNINSPEYLTQKALLDDLRHDLSSLRQTRNGLPQGYVTKDLEIQNKIDKKSKEEIKMVLSMSEIEKGGLKAGQMYLSWLRIAVLLINLLLVHKIIQIFVRERSVNHILLS